MIYFDLASDLHTDLWRDNINSIDFSNPLSSTLVIAGDTSNYVSELLEIVKNSKKYYENVIIIDGNHEHYFSLKNPYMLESYLAREITSLNGNYLCGKSVIKINKTAFIGANGWYDFKINEENFTIQENIKNWNNFSNDSRMILWQGSSPTFIATDHFKLLSNQVNDLQNDNSVDNIVIITHTAPHKKLLPYKGDYSWDCLTSAYGNSMMENIIKIDKKHKIKVWVYGHSHSKLDKTINNIRYVNNARGYESEKHILGKWSFVQIKSDGT